MIHFVRNGIQIGEIYFTETPPVPQLRVDLLRFISVLSPADPLQHWHQGYTLIIDLSQPEEDVFSQMEKDTRYEVRRAMTKDNITISYTRDRNTGELTAFCRYYDEFAQAKALRPVYRERLEQLAQHGMLTLSRAQREDGTILVQHAYVTSGMQASLLHSASHFRLSNETASRNLIGRANRYLHWQDMCIFQQQGIAVYDMGGIDATGRTPETTRIAEFKKSFGGTIVPVYSKTTHCSLKGLLALHLLKWMRISF